MPTVVAHRAFQAATGTAAYNHLKNYSLHGSPQQTQRGFIGIAWLIDVSEE